MSTARRLSHYIAPMIALTILLWCMFPGSFRGWSEGYIGGSRGDAGIYVYLEKINASRFFTWPSEGFDLPTFYPWRRGLAFSDNFLLPSLLAKLLYPMIGSDSIVYNLILVSALLLNGFCAYLLALRVTRSPLSALFAGFGFMCCPYFVFHRGHPQLQFAFWIPLTLLGVLKFAEERSARAASLMGASVAGAFFCSVYYAMYCYLLAGIGLFGCILLRPRSWRIRNFLTLAVANLPWIGLIAPAMIPYMETRDALGTNPIFVLKAQSPTLTAFMAAPPVNELWAYFTRPLSRMEGFLFFGCIPLALCVGIFASHLVDLCKGRAMREQPRLARWIGYTIAALLVVGFARGIYFSLYPNSRTVHHLAWIESETLWAILICEAAFLWILSRGASSITLSRAEVTSLLILLGTFFVFATLGIHDGGEVQSKAPELYRLLLHLPGYNALRGLSRMGIVTILIALVLASIGLQRVLENQLFASAYRQRALIAALIALLGVELHSHQDIAAPLMKRSDIYATADNLPTREAIVALPIQSTSHEGRSFMMWNSLYMQWLAQANNPLLNGFSGKAPLFHSLVSHELDTFPSRRSLSLIGSLVGTRYVITDHAFYGPRRAKEIRKAASEMPQEIEPLGCDSKNSCLFRVSPIISTKELPAPELLFTPHSGEPTVTFEMKQESETPTSAVNVALRANSATGTFIKEDLFSIPPDTEWHSASFVLPRTTDRVSPTVVKIAVEGAPGILIRGIKAG